MKSCRIIALILAILMAFAILSGCQSEKKTETMEETKTEEKKEEAKAKEDKPETSDGPTPIVIFFQDDNVNFPQTIDRPNNQKINEIAKEKFNIEIIIETCISSEMESAVNTRLAAGADVPDMITYDFSIQRVSELYDQGLILGLTDLINEHAPELKFRMMEDNPAIMAAHADSDGEILRVPSCEESIQHEIYVMHLRHDWLTKLGIEFPTTPDEFLSVLKAFQDNDMNGNGKKDEIFTPGSVQTLNVSLSSAFDVYGLRNAEKSWYVDDDGKVYNSMVSDAAKDYVAYVAKLAEEGVLDMEFTNQTADMINQKRYNNRVSGTTGAWWDSVVLDVQIAEKVPGATYVPMEPLKSASGKQMILRRNNVGWSPHMITAQCADPVGCIKLLDWCYTKEGTQILYFGEAAPGGDYYETPTDVPEGLTDYDYQLVYTEKGKKAMEEEPELWAKMGWNCCSFLPQFFESSVGCIALEFYTAFGMDACGLAADVKFNQDTLNKFINDIGYREIVFATPTPEQIDDLNNYDDLWIYMNENFQAFMLGNKPISEWDSFVDECYALGLQNAIDNNFQPRYEAFLEIIG